LKYGKRGGERSLDNLPFGCVVYGADSLGLAPEWVNVLLNEAGGSPDGAAEFRFCAESRDIHLLPRASVLFVDIDVAVVFLGQFFALRRVGVEIVVVGEPEGDAVLTPDEGDYKVRVAAAPNPDGGLSWLQQFS